MNGLTVDARVVRGDFTLNAALQAPPGETVVVVGPNGSGKTTLLAAVAGLAPVQQGRISVGDTVYDDTGSGTHLQPQRRRCAVVFQDLRLFPAMNVLDNVAFGLRAQGRRRPAAREQALDALTAVDLVHLARRPISDLSGGEAQRVALARALAADPRVLLLDEALAALDIRARAQTRTLLRRVLSGLGIPRVIVTHDPVEALSLADQLVVVEDGAVTFQGPADKLPVAPSSAFLATIVGLNVVRGIVRRRDGDAWIDGPGVELFTVTDEPDGTAALGVFAPEAVTLSTQRPSGSARNVLAATITGVAIDGGRAHIRLDGPILLHADITAASVQALALRPGLPVWASVKATEVRVEPV